LTQLDNGDGPERPWTPRGSSTPAQSRRGSQITSIEERFVVVEGLEANLLRAEQTRALLALLTWLADNNRPGTGAQP
jgi:hypothetical protein